MDESLSEQAFQSLTNNFHGVLDDLNQDDHLLKFREEYERLYKALEKTIQNEKTLSQKCQELNQEIIKNATKVDQAMKLSSEDQKTIEALSVEIQKAWGMVEASNKKYSDSQRIIKSLSEQVNQLNEVINRGRETREIHDREIKALIEKKNQLEERKYQMKRTNRLIEEKIKAVERQIGNEEMNGTKLQQKIENLIQLNSDKISEISSKENQVLQFSNDNIDLKKEVEKKAVLMKELENKLKVDVNQLKQQKEKLKKAQNQLNNHIKMFEELNKKVSVHQEQLDAERETFSTLENSLQQSKNELMEQKALKKEIMAKLELEKKKHVKFIIDRKKLKKKNSTLVEGHEGILKKIEVVEEEQNQINKKWDVDKKKIERKNYEKNKLKIDVVEHEKELEKQINTVKQTTKRQDNNRLKVASLRRDIYEKNLKLQEIENEREKHSRDASEHYNKLQDAEELLKVKILDNYELQKRIVDNYDLLKQQQTKYEHARQTRNNYNRGLVEANEQLAFLRRKFDIMSQQIQQLDEEIISSDQALSATFGEKKEIEALLFKKNTELTQMNNSKKMIETSYTEYSSQINKLQNLIKESDTKRKNQILQLKAVTVSRDLLGSHLLLSNDSLALMKEKVKVHNKILVRGQMSLSSIRSQIHKKEVFLSSLQRELVLLKNKLELLNMYKQQIIDKKLEINEEKKRVLALSEEVEDPTKLKRWRKVKNKEYKDENIEVKIQKLQKRLILQTEKMIENEIVIKSKEKQILELEKIKKQQPSKKKVNKLNQLGRDLKKINEKIKTIASEVNTNLFIEREEKYEIKRLNKEIKEVKKDLYAIKRI